MHGGEEVDGPEMLAADEDGKWVSYVYRNPASGDINTDPAGESLVDRLNESNQNRFKNIKTNRTNLEEIT